MDSGRKPESSENLTSDGRESDTGATSSNSTKVLQNNVNIDGVFTSAGPQGESSSSATVESLDARCIQEDSHRVNTISDSCSERQMGCGGTSSLNTNKVPNSVNVEASSSKIDYSPYDNGIETSQRHRVCADNSNCSVPSTSGGVRPCDNVLESSGFRESRKRPSSLKLNRPNLGEEDSSSDTGNDDYSLGSEDGCIYTYRGGEHLADLPSSFFSLDMGLPLDRRLPLPPNYAVQQQAAPNAREQGSRASSPDMDFLEMDFDPGPSCDVDTGDESTPDADLELDEPINMPEENEPPPRVSPEFVPIRTNPQPVCPGSSKTPHHDSDYYYSVPSTSRGLDLAQGDKSEEKNNHSYGPYIKHVNIRGEQLLVRRTMCHWPMNAPVSQHVSSGDLVSPKEILNYDENQAENQPLAYQINQGERPAFDQANLSSALYHLNMAKRLMADKTRSDIENFDSGHTNNTCEPTASTSTSSNCPVEVSRCMVWSEREACERQVTQIATSACGATAIVNVFIALGVPVNLDKVNSAVGTRLRANNAPIPRYLLSRSVAGCTAAHLVSGINRSSAGLVTARFFPTHPERAVSLSHWLADWIALGAVPILTLNLQVACDGEIPDAWHHQMVFGVSPRGIYLCNPVECVRETALWPRLTSPSVLLVKTKDVLSRFTPTTDLTPLMYVPDRRFHSFNVLGQVVNVIREWRASGWSESAPRTRHIRIPAAYQAGITVAALTGTEAHRRLMQTPQLPILAAQTDPA